MPRSPLTQWGPQIRIADYDALVFFSQERPHGQTNRQEARTPSLAGQLRLYREVARWME
jgi:hypothetical protein